MSGIDNGQEIKDVKEGINTRASFPKNVRQIGKNNEEPRIYIEDYVVTFFRQLANMGREDIVILVGSCGPVEGIQTSFINGAICVKCTDALTKETIPKDIWDEIYGKLQKYFEGHKILGWGCLSQENVSEDNYGFMLQKFSNIQRKNFPGNDKIFIHYNLVTQDKALYVTCNNELRHCQGYYIYYERNDYMQEYMMNENGNVSQEKDYQDDISVKLRKSINENEEMKSGTIIKGKINTKMARKTYTAVMAAAVFMLVVAAIKSSGYKKEDVVKAVNQQINKTEKKLDNTSDNNDDSGLVIEEITGEIPSKGIDNTDDNSQPASNVIDEATDKNEEELNKRTDEKGNKKDNETADKGDEKDNQSADKGGEGKTDNKYEDKTDTIDKGDKTGDQADANAADTDANAADANAIQTISKDDLILYEVKEGDTLARISIDNYGSMSKVKDICTINGIEDEDMIHEGDKIYLPKK